MKLRLPEARVWVPFAVLGVGAVGLAALVALRPEVEPRETPEFAPLVRVVEAVPGDHRYTVQTHGTVQPRTESGLVPQVAGEVIWVAPNFVSGGFFGKGDPLVRIDPADARVEVESARAAVARGESEFERARTELERQRVLKEKGVASQARIDDAENASRVAEAQLREGRALLARADRDLDRTELRAPFEGRVRNEEVDVGQFVNRGQTIATLYAVDWAEVPLPIPDRELRFVDVPLGMAPRGAVGEDTGSVGPEVRLRAEFGGSLQTWNGRIVRTQGEIDPRSRMVDVVARVEDPYALHEGGEGLPLAVGLFVEAEILGRIVKDVYLLPREVLHNGNPMDPEAPDFVFVVDDEGRLRRRQVEVLRTERDRVVIGAGLEPGERISTSSLSAAVNGMRVRVAGEPDAVEGVGEPEVPREAEADVAGDSS